MDFTLNEQQRQLQQLARSFAYQEIKPRARELDRAIDPRDTYPIDLMRRASQLGLRTMKIPVKYGGFGANCLTETVVLEEIAVGDVGFAMTLQHEWREGNILASYTNDEQRERFLPEFMADETYVTSYAQTEDHAGSDNALPYFADLSAGARTSAKLEGDEWVINGQKRFITNGNISRMIILWARTDPTVPWIHGLSVFLVPRTSPGVRVGRVENKLGIRLNQNAEIIFDNCRIPKENLLGELNKGLEIGHPAGAGSKSKEGAKCLGIARAAYEEAMLWARDHALVEQQRILNTLADMAIEIEMARALTWRAAWLVDTDLEQAGPYEDMVKVCTGEVGVRVAMRALEIFGPEGSRCDLPVEKLVRDALTMLHGGGGNLAYRTRLGRELVKRAAPVTA